MLQFPFTLRKRGRSGSTGEAGRSSELRARKTPPINGPRGHSGATEARDAGLMGRGCWRSERGLP